MSTQALLEKVTSLYAPPSELTVSGPGFTLDPRDQVLHIEGGAHVVTGEAGR